MKKATRPCSCNRESTVVLCEAPVNRFPGRNARIPDMTIAFHGRRAGPHPQRLPLKTWGPDFVLEVASPSTARNDYTSKREDYANLGIPEYWRDPSGGQWHDAPMAGDRLVAGAYRPIETWRYRVGPLGSQRGLGAGPLLGKW